jgi:glycerol-3-phosphate dehydrogenase
MKDSAVNEQIKYDVVIIGGGILGCFAARNLMRWNVSAVLIEAEADVCKGITRANSAIVYTGYDNKPGSLKAALTVQSNRDFAKL